MPEYECKICNYKTKIRNQLSRHCGTNKHKRNIEMVNLKKKEEISSLIISSKITHFPSKVPQNVLKNSLENDICESKKKYRCECCHKGYTRKDNLKRHLTDVCSEKLTLKEENDKLHLIIEEQQGKLDNIVCQNNIQINNINMNIFGKENLSMLTDDVKKELIKGPYKMMPKLLEMIYFNKKFPENHTMKMVNKNKELMKVHKKSGWELVDKVDTIDYLLEDKNYHVDNFYDENSDEFSQFIKRTYKNFRRLFDNRDKDLWKQIKRDVDLLLWNNM